MKGRTAPVGRSTFEGDNDSCLTEELKSKECGVLLDTQVFYNRVYALGVDEAHLLYFWGADFRPRFRQIGYIRARLPSHGSMRTILVAVTATYALDGQKTASAVFSGFMRASTTSFEAQIGAMTSRSSSATCARE